MHFERVEGPLKICEENLQASLIDLKGLTGSEDGGSYLSPRKTADILKIP